MMSTQIAKDEQRRLDKLAALPAAELGAELTGLVSTAAALAVDALTSELVALSQCSRSSTPHRELYDAALLAVAEALFIQFIGTELCAPEPPDMGGAVRLVAEARGAAQD